MTTLLVGALLGALFLGAAIFFLVGFGLWKMAKNAGIPHAWTSFFYPLYNIGLLAERSLYVHTGRQRPLARWSIWLLIGGISLFLLSGVSAFALSSRAAAAGIALLGWALSIVSMLLLYYSLFYVYKDYAPGNEVVLLVISILFSAFPIIFLVVMNVVPVSVAGRCPYGQPRYNRPQGPASGAASPMP